MRCAPCRSAVLTLILGVMGCSDAPEPAGAEGAPDVDPIAQLSPDVRDRVLDQGSSAAGRLAGTLIQNLTAAMEEGGPEGAIDFCSTRAMPITDQVNAALRGMVVKRTSTRIRNPANRPDSLETLALAWFEEQITATDSVPPLWLQPEGDTAVRFYRPLVANAMCIQCHGPAEGLSPAVAEVLAERYPEDQATGYAPGDLRGLIRVTVSLDGAPRGR